MISAIHLDSRLVVPDSLFVALRGSNADGHRFIPQAINNGATAVVCEAIPDNPDPSVVWILSPDCHQALGEAASAFYDHPSRVLKLTGVTGTNGKTTMVTLLHRLFMELGYQTGLLSTIRNLINNRMIPATHTTPDPVQLNRLLRGMADEGCTHCFMEVSSHAADQKRIAGIQFKGGVFTNLTHDHLDYHQTFSNYLKAKKSFFDGLPSGSFALVNRDDRNGPVMLQNTSAARYTYSIRSMADFRCKVMENGFEGLQLNFDGTEVSFRLIGLFNAYNLLAVYSTAVLLDQDPGEVLRILSALEPVDGRFNPVSSPDGVTAIIDYAHTPDALRNVLETIGEIREAGRQLITVAGAGGNRDKTKRPLMASIACQFSDRVILTSDNPRDEEPAEILNDMMKGVEIHQQKKVLIIENRREAIRTASALASAGDIILIAGKGHETYQEIRGEKYPFDDRKEITEIFKDR